MAHPADKPRFWQILLLSSLLLLGQFGIALHTHSPRTNHQEFASPDQASKASPLQFLTLDADDQCHLCGQLHAVAPPPALALPAAILSGNNGISFPKQNPEKQSTTYQSRAPPSLSV